MLDVFRENLRSLKWLLWIVAAAMVLYLGDFFFGPSSGSADESATWAAKVDGEPIPSDLLFNMTRNLDAQYRQIFGDSYQQMRGQLRLGTTAANQLVERKLILDEARRLGLVVAPDEVARAIQDDPAFKDPTGQFIGAERYRQLFERRGGVGAFEQALAEELLIQRWERMLGQAVEVSDAEVEKQYRENNDKTSIDYVVVRSMDQQIDTTVSDAEIAAWYAAHPERYRKDERRRVRFVVLRREALRAKVQVTEDDVRRRYDEQRATFEHGEQRRARHILLRVTPDADPAVKSATRARAEALLGRIRAGEDFAKLAQEHSEDTFSGQNGGDLGFFNRGQMVGPFDEAAFATAPGQLAPLVETTFGFHILQVTDSRPAGVTPFEEVAEGLRRTLESERADALAKTEAARVRAAIDSAARLEEVARAEALEVQSAVLGAKDPVPGLGAVPAFGEAVFKLQPGEVSPTIDAPAGQLIAVVDEIVPPGVAPLEEVRNAARTDLLNDRVKQAAIRRAHDVSARSRDLAAAAKTLGTEVRTAADLTPGAEVPAAGAIDEAQRSMLFREGVSVGQRGVLGVAGGAVIYQVTQREAFDPTRFAGEREGLREQLRRQREGALRQALVARMREGREIEVNTTLVQRFDGGA